MNVRVLARVLVRVLVRVHAVKRCLCIVICVDAGVKMCLCRCLCLSISVSRIHASKRTHVHTAQIHMCACARSYTHTLIHTHTHTPRTHAQVYAQSRYMFCCLYEWTFVHVHCIFYNVHKNAFSSVYKRVDTFILIRNARTQMSLSSSSDDDVPLAAKIVGNADGKRPALPSAHPQSGSDDDEDIPLAAKLASKQAARGLVCSKGGRPDIKRTKQAEPAIDVPDCLQRACGPLRQLPEDLLVKIYSRAPHLVVAHTRVCKHFHKVLERSSVRETVCTGRRERVHGRY